MSANAFVRMLFLSCYSVSCGYKSTLCLTSRRIGIMSKSSFTSIGFVIQRINKQHSSGILSNKQVNHCQRNILVHEENTRSLSLSSLIVLRSSVLTYARAELLLSTVTVVTGATTKSCVPCSVASTDQCIWKFV